MSQNRITLKTIAAECGYSVNTVSRALRNDTKLPPETLEKIQTSARNLGYIRNSLASSLRSGKSHVIAVIVEEIQNPHYSYLVSQLDSKLRKLGYVVMILCSHASEKIEQQMVNIAISHSVDGILLFPHSNKRHSAELITKNQVPLVLIDREIKDFTADIVCIDDYGGGYFIGKRLAELGHQRFLYIAGPLNNDSQPKRQNGFVKALTEAGIPKKNIRIIPSKDMLSAISANTIRDLLLPVDYTAVFSFNDEMAYYAVNCLHNEGFRMPEDLSIAGFDHIRKNISYLLPLSSISCQENCNIAEIAIELLLKRIENPDLPIQSRVLPVSFYDEGTIGPAPM
ncbi:MAG: LacI family DNA-binding transcriptional regulator [Eubacteriales bacterium]|nr:LacI family DNA-binding transcriptional regulator [Eubacteriales bacterium]